MTSTVSPANSRAAASAIIGAIMRPRSVAIVGMSAKPGSAGRIVLELLGNNKFDGPIHLVGRGAAISTATRFSAVSTSFRSALILRSDVAGRRRREAVEGCIRRKVKAAIVFASGFAEASNDGVAEQEASARSRVQAD